MNHPEQIQALRINTGEGLESCKKALIWSQGDVLLAEGYLRYKGCAISMTDKDEWVSDMAHKWAQKTHIYKNPYIQKPDRTNRLFYFLIFTKQGQKT
jgi:translation elongation factor EF-Ts